MQDSPSFKAAELYSVDVDYFTFGSCRLSSGKYYCGAFSVTAPYKGLVDTRPTPHIGSDPLYVDGHVVASGPPTGTRLHLPTNPNEMKLQRPANPAYYEPRHAGGLGNEFTTNAENNGLRTEAPTHISTYGGTGRFNVGHAGHQPRYAASSATSNYATDRGVAEQAYGVGSGGGPHAIDVAHAQAQLRFERHTAPRSPLSPVPTG